MRLLRVLVVVVVWLCAGGAAADLKDLFPGLVQEAQVGLTPVVTIEGGTDAGTFPVDPGEFVSGTFDPSAGVGNLSGQIASQFQRFPVGSTVAAFTFEFDQELNVFTRSTEGLGPLISERAQTTGRGKINFAFGYSRVEFSVFEGDDLDEIGVGLGETQAFTILGDASRPAATRSASYAGGGGELVFQEDFSLSSYTFGDSGGGTIDETELAGFHTASFGQGTISFPTQAFLDTSLDVDVFAFFLNYGATDWLDLGLVVPLLYIEAEGKVVTTGIVDPGTGQPIVLSTRKARDNSFGFGDVITRAKARFFESDYLDAAFRADLVLPTGDEDELRGFGDPAFGGTFIVSKAFDWVAPHANAGLQFRTDDPHQHVFRWASGVDVQPLEQLTLVVDFVGEHHINRDDDFGNDIYALSTGLKVNPWGRFVLAGNALIRLNDEGLRADVIPSITAEYTFR